MKLNTITNTLKGIGFSIFMAAGLVAFSGTEANAQYDRRDDRQERREDREDRREDRQENRDRRDNRNDDYSDRRVSQLARIAREQGFRDGKQVGRADRQDRDRDNARKSPEYKKATNGYYKGLGDKNAYKEIYRREFLEGYNQAYNRNRRNNNYGYGY